MIIFDDSDNLNSSDNYYHNNEKSAKEGSDSDVKVHRSVIMKKNYYQHIFFSNKR